MATDGSAAQWLDDPEELRALAEWLGSWHPERFELAATKAAFDRDTPPRDPSAPAGFLHPAQVALPAGAPPPSGQLASDAAGSLLLQRLRTFTGWVGDGRKLTATGNLRRADGSVLIELLGTDDRFDERVGDRVFRTKSTVELRQVDLVFRLARRAGFVKVRKGAVSATKRGAELGRDPVADWRAALDGLLALGMLRHSRGAADGPGPYWT